MASISTPVQKVPIRGWFIGYLVALAVLTLHGLELTVASLVVYAHPNLVHLTFKIPLWGILEYVITNLILIGYAVAIFVLIRTRKRSAILHNNIFNVLSILFLIAWHISHMKSTVGTVVDSLPSLLLIGYFSLSRRVRRTLTR